MPKIKICGITNIEDALYSSSCGADALGFIFWYKSPRCISLKVAKKIIDSLGPFVSKVGVFVNEEKGKVLDIASYLDLDVLQFHGKEPPSYCNFFKSKFRVIKTFFPEKENLASVLRYKVDAYLFDVTWDSKIQTRNNKKTIGKKHLKDIKSIKDKRIIISGGLKFDNVSYFIKELKPYAVDVASGVESFPGKKDRKLVKLFIKKAKSTTVR